MPNSSQNNPPKLNYAKARGKSKNKNQIHSQEKIPLDNQSDSNNIFAHLNQDNLNYIKKQLKNKKSSNNHQRAKSSNVNSSEFTSSKSLQVRYSSTQRQKNKQKEQQTTLQQQKMYQKYKNQYQVTQRDSREQQTMRQTQVDQQVISQLDNTEIQRQYNGKQLVQFKQAMKSQEPYTIKNQDSHNQHPILQPPPTMFKNFRDSLPSTQSQHVKTSSLQIQYVQKSNKPSIADQSHQKNNFLQYQLKSQNSNNQIGNSVVSVQNQISQDYSTNLKASQFIDYLQSYIQQLATSPYKNQRNLLSNKTSEYNKMTSRRDSQYSEQNYHGKNFKKNKYPYQDNMNKSFQKDLHPSLKGQNKNSSLNNSYEHNYNQRPTQRNPYAQNSPFLLKNNDNSNIHSNRISKISYTNSNNNQSIPNVLINNHQEYNYHGKQSNKISNDQQFIMQTIQQQLEKQKYHCRILALQLQKYKKNQDKNQKQIKLLNKTLNLMKSQMENIKEIYQQQVSQTNKIWNRIQQQKSLTKARHSARNHDAMEQQYAQDYKHQLQKSRKYNNQNHYYKSTLSQNDNQFMFAQFMRFSYNQPIYNQLDKRLYNRLANNFQRGKQNYYKDKQQDKDSLKNSYRKKYNKAADEKQLRHLYDEQQNQRFSRYNKKYIRSQQAYQQNQEDVLANSAHLNRNYYNKKYQSNSYNTKNQNLANQRYTNKKSSCHSNSNANSKQKSSLQKLKQQYKRFKEQILKDKSEEQIAIYKNKNKKNSSNSNRISQNFIQKSPKQFTHVFVK